MDTTEDQVRDLIEKLEKGLNIRALHAHVHKDEGHIDEKTGKVEYNPHIHFGYTNLVIERDEKGHRHGRLTDMNKQKMQQAQDICALALGMERAPHYTKETRKKNLSHQVYRAQQQAEAKAQAALDAADKKTERGRGPGKDGRETGQPGGREHGAPGRAEGNSGTRQAEGLPGSEAKIKDSNLPLEEKVIEMGRVRR